MTDLPTGLTPPGFPTGPVRRLSVEFGTIMAFKKEYAQNLSNGGVFIPTDDEFEMWQPVEVELVLQFSGKRTVLPAEVVHCVPAEVAAGGVWGE